MRPASWPSEGGSYRATRLVPRGRLVVIPRKPHTLNYNAPCEVVSVVLPFLAERLQEPVPHLA